LNKYISNIFDLDGKTAFVIGAGGHICSHLAFGLYESGCNIVVADLRQTSIDRFFDENNIDDTKVLGVEMDATVKQDHLSGLKKATAKFGKVDILVNGAGINSPEPFLTIKEKDWHDVFNSQIHATFLGCQVFGKHMTANKSGSIINISSASAGPPLSKAFAYSASKAAIKNLTQNVAREFAKDGVRVNAIRPGFFPTKWNLENFLSDERIESIMDHTPMRRFGHPKELIGSVIWLSSDSSSFVTGSEVAIDGGFSAMSI